ncbi:hypothetical protein C8F04DRAFT_384168 [Mycena alexandri]|uniref:Secreted protein n=1 Tax=Mycena alexandri TaxID=1745969 RepID=A0AAD6T4X1_9AGAR|nr:hypothetical protein C8F04DRAFT_384168 [Mycena alexandri]
MSVSLYVFVFVFCHDVFVICLSRTTNGRGEVATRTPHAERSRAGCGTVDDPYTRPRRPRYNPSHGAGHHKGAHNEMSMRRRRRTHNPSRASGSAVRVNVLRTYTFRFSFRCVAYRIDAGPRRESIR